MSTEKKLPAYIIIDNVAILFNILIYLYNIPLCMDNFMIGIRFLLRG